jgi:lysophospholipase L1-like esterase
MKQIVCILLFVSLLAAQQPPALMTAAQSAEHFLRMLQLMESTTAAVPGLARAGAPVLENTKHALVSLRAAGGADSALNLDVLTNARAFLALADALPKPYPFPEEGRRQFAELRVAIERAESHFEALLRLKETQLRSPDRDQLGRYREQNLKVAPPQAGKPRVVFFGDSITDGWPLNEYFSDRDFLNRGIGGQITSQMLARMQADVIAHKPVAMVVLAGTNDIARGVPLEVIQNNLTMIATLADAHKIKPVFASILPVHDYHKAKDPSLERSLRRPMASIRRMNEWLLAFCQKRGYPYLDYFSSMLDASGSLKAELAEDGLHPNAAGYRVMAPLALESIDKAAAPPAPEKKKRRFPF